MGEGEKKKDETREKGRDGMTRVEVGWILKDCRQWMS